MRQRRLPDASRFVSGLRRLKKSYTFPLARVILALGTEPSARAGGKRLICVYRPGSFVAANPDSTRFLTEAVLYQACAKLCRNHSALPQPSSVSTNTNQSEAQRKLRTR